MTGLLSNYLLFFMKRCKLKLKVTCQGVLRGYCQPKNLISPTEARSARILTVLKMNCLDNAASDIVWNKATIISGYWISILNKKCIQTLCHLFHNTSSFTIWHHWSRASSQDLPPMIGRFWTYLNFTQFCTMQLLNFPILRKKL